MERTATREQFVAEARSWLGTPFRLQGRLKGVAVDCAGLVIMTARELGLSDWDHTGYGRPRGDAMREMMDGLMDVVALDEAGPGDVLLFRWGNHSTHVAVLTGPSTILHAHAPNKVVVEHDVDPRMWAFLERAYHVRGVV